MTMELKNSQQISHTPEISIEHIQSIPKLQTRSSYRPTNVRVTTTQYPYTLAEKIFDTLIHHSGSLLIINEYNVIFINSMKELGFPTVTSQRAWWASGSSWRRRKRLAFVLVSHRSAKELKSTQDTPNLPIETTRGANLTQRNQFGGEGSRLMS